MLVVDVIASVPFDLIAWVLIGNGHVLGGSLVLALRLLRLLRIVRLFVILRRWEAFSWSNPAVTQGRQVFRLDTAADPLARLFLVLLVARERFSR